MQSLNVLISAYACRPNMGSEPGVGWQTAVQLSQTHRVWVLTRTNNRPSIEAELSVNPHPNLQVVYSQLPVCWLGLRPRQQIHYYLWQIAAYQMARRLHQQHHFDIAHHVTYVKYWSPSFISLLPIPFIWGPVGGGESAPKAFVTEFSLQGQRFEALRNAARWLAERSLFVRLTAHRAAITLATTPETAQRLKEIKAEPVSIYSQLGLTPDELSMLGQCPQPVNPTHFLSIGRMLHWKGFHLSLSAFAQADLPHTVEYWLIGNGPERPRLKALAQALDIQDRVRFISEMARDQVLHQLGSAIALVHPSLHDSGGFVCLEAMAAGLPVLCLDLGGPALQITDQTGIKIAANTPSQTITELAQAMSLLATNAALRVRLGQAGKQRAQLFDSTKRSAYFTQLYHQIATVSS